MTINPGALWVKPKMSKSQILKNHLLYLHVCDNKVKCMVMMFIRPFNLSVKLINTGSCRWLGRYNYILKLCLIIENLLWYIYSCGFYIFFFIFGGGDIYGHRANTHARTNAQARTRKHAHTHTASFSKVHPSVTARSSTVYSLRMCDDIKVRLMETLYN